MDSLTHLLLGACTAALVAPAAQRRAALGLGAVLGSLPDLDVLIDFGGPVENFTMHRSFTHSLLVLPWVGLTLWAALLAWAPVRAAKVRWLGAVQVALLSHPLLDACTIYGTQLWWPLDHRPLGLGNLFIIDPLYTLPLLAGFIGAWRCGPAARARFWLGLGLLASTLYWGWTAYAQQHLRSAVSRELAARGLGAAQVLVQPMPLQSLLWRILVIAPDGDYYEGYHSFVASQGRSVLHRYPGQRWLLAELADTLALERLDWFTGGYYAAELVDGQVVFVDLRMGAERTYVFRFVLGVRRDGRTLPVAPVPLPWPPRGMRELERLWQLLRDPSAAPTTVPAALAPATAP